MPSEVCTTELPDDMGYKSTYTYAARYGEGDGSPGFDLVDNMILLSVTSNPCKPL